MVRESPPTRSRHMTPSAMVFDVEHAAAGLGAEFVGQIAAVRRHSPRPFVTVLNLRPKHGAFGF